MKTIIAALAAVILALPAMAEEKKMDHGTMDHGQMMDHSKMDHGSMAKAEETKGVGVINSVDADNATINITHEPMPEIGWPTMTMDLPVTKHVDLSTVKTGDKVDFTVKLGRDGKYRVMDMQPAN